MCEQMGWEPKEEDIPIELNTLSLDCQYAVMLLQVLPDNWEGMSGAWLGKDYSGLGDIMDIYQIENKKEVFELLQVAEAELGKYYDQKRKEQDSMNKAKRA